MNPRVDRHARVMVRNCQYSVPAKFIGRRVRVHLRSNELIILDGRTVIARHERSSSKGVQVLDLDHYLEVLKFKLGALPGATALMQARKAGSFTNAHEAFWAAARKARGDGDGTRELIDVLLLHRHMAHADVVAGLTAALSVGATTADVVAVEARKQQPRTNNSGTDNSNEKHAGQGVVSLTERRLTDPSAVIAGLPADTRPLPSVAGYDELLTRRRTAGPATTTHTEKGTAS